MGDDGDIVAGERDRWIAFWTDETADPRDVIARELGLKKDRVKKLVNSAINGSQNRLSKWIETNFPCLFKIWMTTNLKETGNQISKTYETDIMLNGDFFKFVQSLGIRVMPEHDGYSIFSSRDDDKLPEKLKLMVHHLKEYSNRKFCVPIVLTVKNVISLN